MEWALEYFASIDRDDSKLGSEVLEAKAKADTGRYGDAARILWELLVQVRHLRNTQLECMIMVHMGKVYRALRWKIAIQLFEDAVDLADRIDFGKAKMMALAELGEIKCQWGQFKESLDLLDKAMALIGADEPEIRRSLLLDMTVAYEGLNDMGKCEELLDQIVEIDRKIESDELEDDLDHLERIRMATRT